MAGHAPGPAAAHFTLWMLSWPASPPAFLSASWRGSSSLPASFCVLWASPALPMLDVRAHVLYQERAVSRPDRRECHSAPGAGLRADRGGRVAAGRGVRRPPDPPVGAGV